MLWTLLIWAIVGLVVTSIVWPIGVLVRAAKNGYNLECYMDCMLEVLEDDDAELKEKYNRFERFMLAVFHNALWPYKLIWLTRKFVPRFDERHVDILLEKIREGEHA